MYGHHNPMYVKEKILVCSFSTMCCIRERQPETKWVKKVPNDAEKVVCMQQESQCPHRSPNIVQPIRILPIPFSQSCSPCFQGHVARCRGRFLIVRILIKQRSYQLPLHRGVEEIVPILVEMWVRDIVAMCLAALGMRTGAVL